MAVFGQLLGALTRAAVVMFVVATPSLLLPGTTPEGAQMVTLVGLALAVFVCIEYASSYPALIEFRDAPPVNRVRILALLAMLIFLSVVAHPPNGVTGMVLVLNALGVLVGSAADFPFSPLTVVLDHLPDNTSYVTRLQVQIMAGLAIFITMVAIFVFALLLRFNHWPNRGSAFNVWVNLPTFEPTQGGDIVTRLTRDARLNIILGLTMPFVIPHVYVSAAEEIGLDFLASPHALVWGIALWMFLPFSVLIRGLAMQRIAQMIMLRRARLTADVSADAPSASPSFSQ